MPSWASHSTSGEGPYCVPEPPFICCRGVSTVRAPCRGPSNCWFHTRGHCFFSCCPLLLSSSVSMSPALLPSLRHAAHGLLSSGFAARCPSALNFLLLPVDGAPCIFASFLIVAWLHLVLLLADVGIRDQRSPSLFIASENSISIPWNSAVGGTRDRSRDRSLGNSESSALTIRLALCRRMRA